MKRLKFRIPALFLLFALALSSCIPEDEVDPDYGDPRDKFVGTWRLTENEGYKNGLGISYTIIISYDPGNSAQVLLKNFCNAGNKYSAYGIVTTSRISIPAQEMAPGFLVSGTGNAAGKSGMNWEYVITAGGDQNRYTATAVKQ